MYSEENLKQLKYQLHAVLVHEGSINSGHYWTYIFCHKRKVWLKFNDNTVTEVDWEELKRESFGGHSNASAYSLIYYDTSKANVILDAEANDESTDENKMDQEGGLDSLILSLPNDLAEYVRNHNQLFTQECQNWDDELEKKTKAKEEAEKVQPSLAFNTDGSNDLQVLKEKLTYVNWHAKLSYKISRSVIKKFKEELEDHSYCPASTLQCVLQTTKEHYGNLKDTDYAEVRLISFIVYLQKNRCSPNVIHMALLEQFSLPGLERESEFAGAVYQASYSQLGQVKRVNPEEARLLKEWHQAYHHFRVSSNYYMLGLQKLAEKVYEEALDCLFIAYSMSIEISEKAPKGHFKALKTNNMLRLIRISLIQVNSSTICLFKSGKNPVRVQQLVNDVIGPILLALQQRVNREYPKNSAGNATVSAKILEDIRNSWCNLLGDTSLAMTDMLKVSDYLTVILDPPQNYHRKDRLRSLIDRIDQKADLVLAKRYDAAMKGALLLLSPKLL